MKTEDAAQIAAADTKVGEAYQAWQAAMRESSATLTAVGTAQLDGMGVSAGDHFIHPGTKYKPAQRVEVGTRFFLIEYPEPSLLVETYQVTKTGKRHKGDRLGPWIPLSELASMERAAS